MYPVVSVLQDDVFFQPAQNLTCFSSVTHAPTSTCTSCQVVLITKQLGLEGLRGHPNFPKIFSNSLI